MHDQRATHGAMWKNGPEVSNSAPQNMSAMGFTWKMSKSLTEILISHLGKLSGMYHGIKAGTAQGCIVLVQRKDKCQHVNKKVEKGKEKHFYILWDVEKFVAK